MGSEKNQYILKLDVVVMSFSSSIVLEWFFFFKLVGGSQDFEECFSDFDCY